MIHLGKSCLCKLHRLLHCIMLYCI